MSGQVFTVTVAGGSRAHGRRGTGAHMTLHRIECGQVKRAREVRPGYLAGWVTPDGKAVDPAAPRVEGEVYDRGLVGEVAWARKHAEQAAAGVSAYRVCGTCKPDPFAPPFASAQ